MFEGEPLKYWDDTYDAGTDLCSTPVCSTCGVSVAADQTCGRADVCNRTRYQVKITSTCSGR